MLFYISGSPESKLVAMLAKLIFGLENPSGKLAMTFPRSVGQIPIFYNQNQSARVGDKSWSGLYQDIESTPMYEFGHGLSYTTFTYQDLTIDSQTLEATVKGNKYGEVERGKRHYFGMLWIRRQELRSRLKTQKI